ncbi:hypothetical protein [Streptomonospora litoralis]|nr:hypothetical protein [Streptomonospora litoralis]
MFPDFLQFAMLFSVELLSGQPQHGIAVSFRDWGDVGRMAAWIWVH